MKIKKGTTRIAWLIPFFGIVIKFPVIKPKEFFICLRDGFRNWEYMKIQLRAPIGRGIPKFKDCLFWGIKCNWQEFCFYIRTRNIFLQPTYFSLFGLVNIQRLGKPCKFTTTDLWCQLHELTNGKVWAHSHHFAEPDNFCFDGTLRIVDYGDKRTQGVVSECGLKIVNEFDPTYNREEKKKALKAQGK